MKLSFDPTLLGLERRDLAVYEAMLTNPEARSIRTIAALVNMNRGTTFEIIKKLVQCGLVAGFYKNSRKNYCAEPPEALQRLAEDRQAAVKVAAQEFADYARQLEHTRPREAGTQFGKFYEGEEEIAVLLQDVLATVAAQEEKIYRVISSAEVSSHLYGNFRNFTRQRIKQKLFVRVIGVGKTGEDAALAERKMLTTENIPASYVIIYGNKVAQITLTDLGNIQGTITEDMGVAQLQQLLFDRLWETL